MDDLPRDTGHAEPGPSDVSWWPSGFVEKLQAVSLGSQEEDISNTNSTKYSVLQDEFLCRKASQSLWATGMLSGPIPNGFYSIVPDKKLKEIFSNIPTIDEFHALGMEGFRADIILVDSEKDKKLSMLKQLIVALVKGLNFNPTAMIKKIAGLVSDFYKHSNSELSSAKSSSEEVGCYGLEGRHILLGQAKHGSCRHRAILFKVLADAVGLDTKLIVGLPSDGTIQCTYSHKHVSVVVVLNSVELLVDLIRFPGQLILFSSRAVFMCHASASVESDSAENDSCDSPLEPNSPLYGVSEKLDGESSSHSEPNIANAFWRRYRKKVVTEQRTTSSSPEHPLFRARGRSMLSGDRQPSRDYADGIATSRSDGAPTSDARRIRRSISITPEIGDDIVRAVRAMNETLKQNRLLKEQGDNNLGNYFPNTNNNFPDAPTNSQNFLGHGHDETSDERTVSYNTSRNQVGGTLKATSLPSSPHEFRGQTSKGDLISTWNKVLQSSSFLNKPLFPFQEWNIDFSELTVGTRVGIGFFGEVFRGIWNGTDVAIKIFLEQDLTAENMEDFCNEISLLSRLRHPNVILFLGACTKPPHLSMVTEYMEMGSLYYLIHSSGQEKKLSWRRRLKMLRDICRGLMCIHRMKIVHRDLKSANCLVNKHWTVKICDFGLSRIMTKVPMQSSSSAGTPEWMAPELIRNEPFTQKCDIFSLGVIMWELFTLRRPWEGVSPDQVVYAVANEGTQLEIPEGPLGKLISDCWAEAENRPSCEEILSRLLDCECALY